MPGQLLISERLYEALLYLYPKKFRAAYGRPMCLTFRDACRAAVRQNGTSGLIAVWFPTLLDLFKSALEERARHGELTMSKTRLIALAGPLTILVGSVWLVASLSDLVRLTGLVEGERIWDLFLAVWALAFFLSFVPMFFALAGTRLRFHPSAGVLGRLGLAVSVAGGAGVIVAVLANLLLGGLAPVVNQLSWANYAAVISFMSIRIGFILFGMDALRNKPLPRWNLLPLLLGLTVVLGLPFEWFGVPGLLPVPWFTPSLHSTLTGTCWVLLGVALMDPGREPQPTAVA